MAISEQTKNLQAEIGAWIANSFIDRMVRYASAGRRHSGLGAAQLERAWVMAVQAMADNVRCTALRDRQHELEAEFRLRRVEPPYHLVQAAIAAYAKRAEQMLVEMVRDEPERVAALTRTIEEELEAGRGMVLVRS